ncbi:fungal-specific transcription factor domain-containing protein [Lipomyces oligophaga]|uniref:fungal-specific transcription factor domain-containing protein n=1 Tax=Lipomyces oligophaga TaxID=45792 RepID=UPI0034CE224A
MNFERQSSLNGSTTTASTADLAVSPANALSKRPLSQSPSSGETSTKRARSIAACNRCKARKQRCDNGFPKCSNCTKAGADCISKELAYPASYVRSLEDHVHALEETIKNLNNQVSSKSKAESTISSSGQKLPPLNSQLDQHGAQKPSSQTSLPSLPSIDFVKTSLSSSDLSDQTSRDLVGMTASAGVQPSNSQQSFYLGSASGFPLTKLVQAAIFGRSLPKTLIVQSSLPQLPPLHKGFPKPDGAHPAPEILPPPLPSISQLENTSDLTGSGFRRPSFADSPTSQTALPRFSHQSQFQSSPQVGFSEAQFEQSFLSALPSDELADRLVSAYLRGVHHRYPILYKGDIYIWNNHRTTIAKKLAAIAAKKYPSGFSMNSNGKSVQPSASITSPNSQMAVPAGSGFPINTEIHTDKSVSNQASVSVSESKLRADLSPTLSTSSPSTIVSGTTTTSSSTPASSASQASFPLVSSDDLDKAESEYELQSIWFKLHMVYAIGAGYLHLTGGTYSGVSPETHYYVAMRYLDILSDAPLIDIIEKLLMVIIFQLRSPSGPGIWHLTGFTMRVCIEAGLHRKSKDGPALEDQHRRILFWSLYVLERSVSITLGRPFCLADRDIDIEFPFNVDEDVRDPKEFEIASQSCEMSKMTSMTSVILIMQIKTIASHIQEKIYRVDKQELPVQEKFRDIQRELVAWGNQIESCKEIIPLSTVPTPRLHRSQEYFMLNYHANMRLLLVPKLPSLSSDSEEFQLCLRSSGHICQIYKRLHQYLQTVSYSFLALQATYMAGITMVYCYTKDPSILDDQFRSDIGACSAVLYIITDRWAAAKHFRDSFDTFLNSAIDSRELSTDRSSSISSKSEHASIPEPKLEDQAQQSPVATLTQLGFTTEIQRHNNVPAGSATTATPAIMEGQTLDGFEQVPMPSVPQDVSNATAFVSSAESTYPLSQTVDLNNSRYKGVVDDLGPVQGELWDILQQGTQQQQADLPTQLNAHSVSDSAMGTPQFDSALNLAIPLSGMSRFPGVDLGMGMGGRTGLGMSFSKQGPTMSNTPPNQGGPSFSQSFGSTPYWYAAHNSQQLSQTTTPSTSNMARQSAKLYMPSATGEGLTIPDPLPAAHEDSSSLHSIRRSGNNMPVHNSQQVISRSTASLLGGGGTGHSVHDMDAEMGTGVGNAALFRWAGNFGDLYY